MKIGELARETGVSVRALRYYEEHGLLVAGRTSGSQRVYGDDAVQRVRLLRRLFTAGLSSSVIATLLPCVDSPSDDVTAETLAVMRGEHARLGEQVRELRAARRQLGQLIEVAEQFHESQTAAQRTVA